MAKKQLRFHPLPSTLGKETTQLSELEKVEEAVYHTHTAPTWKEYLQVMDRALDYRQVIS